RHAGQAPLPPRTLVQQNVIVQQNITNVNNVNVVNNNTTVNKTVVNNNQVLMAPSALAASKGQKTVSVDTASRQQALQQAQNIQQVGVQRGRAEVASGPP